jgi:predicted PurR-regulated permease PerM
MQFQSTSSDHPRGLVGTCLAILFIGVLIGSSYLVLMPFLPALVWAIMIVISTWPLMLAAQRRLKGRRSLATAVMLVSLLIIFVLPLSLAISAIVDNTDKITDWAYSISSFERPVPPTWLADTPLVGSRLVESWNKLASVNKDDVIARASPYMGDLMRWFVDQVGNLGMLFIHFGLTLILAAVLYMKGEVAGAAVNRFAVRLAAQRGEESVLLAANAIRAVALGVVGTALVQSMIAWFGFVVAGVPQSVLLAAFCFFFAVIQIGAVPIMLFVVIWLYYTGSTGWAIAMLLWTGLVGVLDNILRPILIRRGADLPLLLIFGGVIGGLVAFGIIGLFVGPVVLAVTYTLLNAWIADSK